ncbi:siderophore transport transcriptional regulator MmpR5 [Nonomuraea roseoviolacea subsp. roseoviolacea]|uniref:DNA-binding transcriptional regulator GbsR (MarR family) n=1 Tax=Nonomuraea roseoviolacea subsp. carminata TaxID=160689 RepID=A0ABT1KF35_9ACTN|nr:MarR family transcriptional regulator [Nonomuraea roseoviolacea]MCP2352633.1 DNA-binding transcriptional regulator GbsR (MarR family) [Nonomuraea roseoviolacea subsp. carminata]
MMDPREGEFVDRMGLVMERFGRTRTMGRLYAWLMVCDPPHQSLTELAARLGVSKTAVSTIARQLELSGMIERVPTAGREHRYQVAAGGWEHVMKVQFAALRQAVEALDLGLSAVGGDRPEQRARLEETRDFFAWTERDADDMLRRWRDSRAEPDR